MRKSGIDVVPKQGVFQGAPPDGMMSISMNSNEEISFVTPDSQAGKTKMNLKNNLFAKRGAVPNTKLIFEDNHETLFSPMQIENSKEVSMSSGEKNQQNPAIYEVFRPLDHIDTRKYKTNKENYKLSDLSDIEER